MLTCGSIRLTLSFVTTLNGDPNLTLHLMCLYSLETGSQLGLQFSGVQYALAHPEVVSDTTECSWVLVGPVDAGPNVQFRSVDAEPFHLKPDQYRIRRIETRSDVIE